MYISRKYIFVTMTKNANHSKICSCSIGNAEVTDGLAPIDIRFAGVTSASKPCVYALRIHIIYCRYLQNVLWQQIKIIRL